MIWRQSILTKHTLRINPFIAIFLILFIACDPTNKQSTFDVTKPKIETTENPKSIYGEWTLKEIVDSLYTDTLTYRNTFDSTKADTFYLNRILKLIQNIRADSGDTSTLFPKAQYDKVTAKDALVQWNQNGFKVLYGMSKTLTKTQAEELLRIINNPLGFTWSECGTWTPTARFDFYQEGEIVRTIDVGCSWQFKTDFEKLKFGTLADPSEFKKLCSDIGLENQ